MPNVIFHGTNLRGKTVNAVAVGDTQSGFSASGIAEVDPTDTALVTAITEQGGARVDVEGTEEALTAGTVQTAITLSALVIRNGAAESVINVRNQNGTGDLLIGPITLAAGEERVIVFPTALAAADGVFIDVDSGGLNATPGFLIP